METSSLPLICPLLLIFRILGDISCQSPSGLQPQEYGDIALMHLQNDNRAAIHLCYQTRATDVELLTTETDACHGIPSLNRYSYFKNYLTSSESSTTVSLTELRTILQFNDDVYVDGCPIDSLDFTDICENKFATSDASPKESLLPNWLLVSVVAIIFLVSFFGCASCNKETTNGEEDTAGREDIDGNPTDTHDIVVRVIPDNSNDDHHNGYVPEDPDAKMRVPATSNVEGDIELDVGHLHAMYEPHDETSKQQSGDQKSNRISDRFMSMYVRKEEAIRQDSINDDTLQQTTPNTKQRDFNLLADLETSTTQQLTDGTKVNRLSISDKIFDFELGATHNTDGTGDVMSRFIEQDLDKDMHAEHSTSNRLEQPVRRISAEISPTLIADEFGSDHIDHTDTDMQSANDRDYDYHHDKPEKDHESFSSSDEDSSDFVIK